MWHPSKRATQQVEAKQHTTEKPSAREDDRKRWWGDGDGNDESMTTTTTTTTTGSNIDSGFLSSGNLQISGESLESLEGKGDEGAWREEKVETRKQQQQRAGTTAAAAPSSSSSSSTATAIVEPMRADSGLVVDLSLSESLSQLSLKQVVLNPLAGDGNGGTVQVEPTFELSPVIANSPSHDVRSRNDIALIESRLELQQQRQQQQQCHSCGNEDAATNNAEPYWLYYAQDDDGDTQLHIAIVQGFVEAAFSLIKIVPDPLLLDILNDDWQSPLHLAVLTHQPMIVRRLILAGADPSQRNFRGNTALHLACMTADVACAKALTDSLSPMERNELMPGQKVPAIPQNLEQRNYNGEMCLHVAAANGHVELVRLLLRLGADLEAREGLAGKTALHIAVERGCRQVVAFLLQECRPCLNTRTYAGLTAYQLALCFDDSQLARELVRLGASPQPLPESSDSESEDEEPLETSPSSYVSTIVNVQNAVGVGV